MNRGRAAVLALTLFSSLLSCGREITGPGGPGARAEIHFVPNYASMIEEVDGMAYSVAGLVPFTKVRIELRRVDNTIAAVKLVDFPAAATELALNIDVRLGAAATSEGESLTAFIRYINAAGDTVFSGGPISVIAKARRGSSTPPVEVPIVPTVPGAVFARIEMTPDTLIAASGGSPVFTAVAFDGQNNVVANAIIGFISRNPAIVAVPNLGSGTVNLVGARGTTWLIAQSLTGVKDSSFIHVLPQPASLTKVSGDGQTAVQGQAFAQPLRVRVLASDNLPIANWPVTFAVSTGGGNVNFATVNTDVGGFAEVTWTAGATIGGGSVTASATGSISVTFNGTQATSLPTSLVYLTQPSNITAGAALSNIQVEVRNGANQLITDYAGSVTLALTGGTAGAALVGTTTVGAVAGVATFSGISVNKGGAGYRLLVSTGALNPLQSNTFDVANAPATTITVVGGSGQSAPPSTLLTDSVKVRVTDMFGFPVVGQAVQFTVTQGGGTLSAASGITDNDGRTAVRWTLGATGAQQMRASVGALEQLVSADIVASGSIALFAGFDYTLVRAGGQKLIPIFLTNPSPSPVEVALSVDAAGAGIIAWQTPSIEIGAGVTRVDVPINGLDLGSAWAIVSSAVGTDSLLVTVDSSFVQMLATDEWAFGEGDTVRTRFLLSEPAPAGGLLVTVRSQQPAWAVVAPSAGTGTPQPGCVDDCYGSGSLTAGLVAATPMHSALLAPPADTAVVLVPEGHVYGEFAIILLDDAGEGVDVDITVEAAGHVGDSRSFYIAPQELDGYTDYYNNPSNGIGVGQMTALQFYAQVRSLKPQVVRLESSNSAVATVDSTATIRPMENYAVPATVRVHAADSAWIRFWMGSLPMDSILIVGDAPTLELSGQSELPELGGTQISVHLGSAMNLGAQFRPSGALTISVVSDNPAVAEVERGSVYFAAGVYQTNVGVQMMAPGSANIIVSAPGYTPDTLAINTTSPTLYVGLGASNVGVNQLLDGFVQLGSQQVAGGARTIDVVSLNPSVAEVITPRLEIGRDSYDALVRIRGVQTGSATIRFSGAGVTTTEMVINVSPTLLYLGAQSPLAPDGVDRTVTAFVWDGYAVRPMASTITGVLRSSDPSVVQVTDSLLEFTPAASYDESGTIRPLSPGSATLWLVRPGVDSVSYMTTVSPYEIAMSIPQPVIGRHMQSNISLWRAGPDTLSSAISITHSGPGLVSFTELPEYFSTGQHSLYAPMVGEVAGVDTLTITVDGYAPITRIVNVVETKPEVIAAGSDEVVDVTNLYYFNGFSVPGGETYPTIGKRILLQLTSLDTARVEVLQDTIDWMPGDAYNPTRFAAVRFKQPGLATLVISDLGGVLEADTLEFYVYPAELSGGGYASDKALSIGMGQRTEIGELYVRRGSPSATPLWVTLTSSNPALVQAPDSVLIAADDFYAYFELTSGDSTGSARVTASAPGYNPWHWDVLVTRGAFGVWADDGFLDGGVRAEVYVMDAVTNMARTPVAPVAARFATTTPSTLDATPVTFTYPAESLFATFRGPVGVGVGPAQLRVDDDRGAIFARMVSGTSDLEVYAPQVRVSERRVILTPGLISEVGGASINVQSGKDSVWVHATGLHSKFAVEQDSTLVIESILSPCFEEMSLNEMTLIGLRGLALGRDTLVVSANGIRADTVLVDVVQGVLRLATTMPRIAQGDSVLVLLTVGDGAGQPATAFEDIEFSVSVGANFVVRQNGANVSTVTLPEGGGILAFWVQATAGGDGALTLTQTNFRTFTINLSAVGNP